jgi:hypothetical protein
VRCTTNDATIVALGSIAPHTHPGFGQLATGVACQCTGAINVSITVPLKPPRQIPCLHHSGMLICALMNKAETKLLKCALCGHLPDTFSRWVRQRTDHLTVRRLPSNLY